MLCITNVRPAIFSASYERKLGIALFMLVLGWIGASVSGGSVHMNGRIYDPLLGRMLSADPFIQSPANFQNYNRYSYVTNNPLSVTDPSGFFLKKLFKSISKFIKKFFQTIVTIALVATGNWWALVAFTIAMGGVTGGLRGALIAAASVAITWFIGSDLGFGEAANFFEDPLLELARATAHGISQGGLAELSGGDFGASFLAGFSGSIAGSMTTGTKFFGKARDGNRELMVRRTVAAAVVGGTVSEIGGGKFANGAATAAMVSLFSEFGSRRASKSEQIDDGGDLTNFSVRYDDRIEYFSGSGSETRYFGGSGSIASWGGAPPGASLTPERVRAYVSRPGGDDVVALAAFDMMTGGSGRLVRGSLSGGRLTMDLAKSAGQFGSSFKFAYQGVVSNALNRASVRYGVFIEQTAEALYNWGGGDGVPTFTPGAAAGDGLNFLFGSPFHEQF